MKGLSSRKTLGQWLDERGVTAKPRLTLADQVQQHSTPGESKKSRSSAAAAAAQAAAQAAAAGGATAGARAAEELAVAAANAARLTAGGNHKAPAAVPASAGGSWGSAALQVRRQLHNLGSICIAVEVLLHMLASAPCRMLNNPGRRH